MMTHSFRSTRATAFLILIVSAMVANAATFIVTNADDSGPGSLRDAVTQANTNRQPDTITFDPAVFSTPRTITLTTEIRISDLNTVEDLTIIGPGRDLLTISGNNATRIFLTGQEDTISISGMTLTGGSAADVGGAISNGAATTLTNIVFRQNTSLSGGAIYNTLSGVLNVNGCEFRDNTATGTNINGDGGSAITNRFGRLTVTDSIMTGGTTRGGGGGLRSEGGVVNVSNTTISNNTSGNAGNTIGGGGIYAFGELNLIDCIVSGNTAGEGTDGGGIYNEGQLRLVRSIVMGNSARRHGGGIYDGAALGVTIIDSTISNNTANIQGTVIGRGGGIFVEGGSASVTITGSTISGNNSPGDGGGIFTLGGLTLQNTTMSGNSSGNVGGAIYDDHPGGSGGIVTLDSSTIVNNQANQVGGVENRNTGGNAAVNIRNTIIANNTGGTSPDVRNAFNSQGYNLIENTAGATIVGDTATNITGVDPNLGALAGNGGLTATHALLPGSPALDKGNSFGTTTDQRGRTRPIDDPALPNQTNGDGSDIGAFEVQAPPNTAPGNNVSMQSPAGDAKVNFSNVTKPGLTEFTPIDPPSSAGAPPSGYVVLENAPAYEITTTAGYTAPIRICFVVSSVNDEAQFARLRVLHGEGGQLVDRTVPTPHFPTRTICADVPSLSPFVVASAPEGTPFPAPRILSALSRKLHAGVAYDVDLPLLGTAGIEPRFGGVAGEYQLVVTFANPVSVQQVAVTSADGFATASGTTQGSVVTVNVSGVTNAQTLWVGLNGVSDGTTSGDTYIPMSVLIGDTNSNGAVNATDVSAVKAQSGQPVNLSNFRLDVNTNGAINASDVSFVKAFSGTSISAAAGKNGTPYARR